MALGPEWLLEMKCLHAHDIDSDSREVDALDHFELRSLHIQHPQVNLRIYTGNIQLIAILWVDVVTSKR